ncbi:hypothetical protein [Maribellus sp. YY47]|uniref:SIS domain-containing protein n=1 Tax=Maribellus sp. YY47 TaxID=2929486 RepID=UPI0020013894|nr:hypothetical protein [Maribellus sp. YY47]MCK3685193.1 hypothetical protein [Maribellus sp. YY47]
MILDSGSFLYIEVQQCTENDMVVNELYEIPYRAELCYQKNKGIILPEGVPYIGMGASYIAPKTFRYLGIDLFPEKASDYFNYLVRNRMLSKGVLISQSGESSETLWCADYFSSFTALVNEDESKLSKHPNCNKQVLLFSGDENRIASKTYLNTLLVLYMGFGFDPRDVIQVYSKQLSYFEKTGIELGELIRRRMKGWRKKSIYILGNGPNIATADLAALILSEVLKKPVQSMSASYYDHGYKETSKNTLVVAINHEGPELKRTRQLLKTIEKAGGEVFEINDAKVDPVYSPLTFPLIFFFAAEYLLDKLKIKSIFEVGKKVTVVAPPPKDEQ